MLGIEEGGGDVADSSWKNFSKEAKQRLDQFSLATTRKRNIVFLQKELYENHLLGSLVEGSLNILQAVFENLGSDSGDSK